MRISFRRSRAMPILDCGVVDVVRDGWVEFVAAVEAFYGHVLLADGSRIEPDAVVVSTGFRPSFGFVDGLGRRGSPHPRRHAMRIPASWRRPG